LTFHKNSQPHFYSKDSNLKFFATFCFKFFFLILIFNYKIKDKLIGRAYFSNEVDAILAVNTVNKREIANNYIEAWIEKKQSKSSSSSNCMTSTQVHTKSDESGHSTVKNFPSNKRISNPAMFDYSNEENGRSKRICY
jgi:hypothetical protein